MTDLDKVMQKWLDIFISISSMAACAQRAPQLVQNLLLGGCHAACMQLESWPRPGRRTLRD